MKPLRQLLADRLSALAMIVIIAQLLVLQAVAASYACAGMDATRAGGTLVLCHGEGTSASEQAPPPPQSHDCCTDCLCAIGCGHAPSALAASLDANNLPAAHFETDARLSWPLAVDALGPRAPPEGLAYKRGPPALSV
ncbi:hypothetical protein [Fulvimarina sp. MAC3]|uniref:hypothetical protein n=1 Tax=Fulvimarina sp. MAC3 TaxID=3148887 RepID=UPI0031FBD29F